VAVFFAACNILRVVVQPVEGNWSMKESIPQILMFSAGIFFTILLGLFPSAFLEGLWNKISVFLTLH